MTSFVFTGGDPNDLTAGGMAEMADIQGSLTDIRTFLNSGSIDETNVPNLAAAFTTHKRLVNAHTDFNAAGVVTVMMQTGFVSGGNVAPGQAAALVTNHVFHLDPTLYTANSRLTKLKIKATAVPNAVAPAVTFTVGLYPVATYGGASAAAPIVSTLGTVVTGSGVPIASPPAATLTAAAGSDFNFPAVGAYVLGIVSSGANAAGSITGFTASLEMRQV